MCSNEIREEEFSLSGIYSYGVYTETNNFLVGIPIFVIVYIIMKLLYMHTTIMTCLLLLYTVLCVM